MIDKNFLKKYSNEIIYFTIIFLIISFTLYSIIFYFPNIQELEWDVANSITLLIGMLGISGVLFSDYRNVTINKKLAKKQDKRLKIQLDNSNYQLNEQLTRKNKEKALFNFSSNINKLFHDEIVGMKSDIKPIDYYWNKESSFKTPLVSLFNGSLRFKIRNYFLTVFEIPEEYFYLSPELKNLIMSYREDYYNLIIKYEKYSKWRISFKDYNLDGENSLICPEMTISLNNVSVIENSDLIKDNINNSYIIDRYDGELMDEESVKIFHVRDEKLLTGLKNLDKVLAEIYKRTAEELNQLTI